MSLIGLAHLGIYTKDINKSKKFYLEHFGFKLINELILNKPNNETLKIALIELKGFTIELLESSDVTKNQVGNSGSIEHFAILVDNLDELVLRLKESGIIFETEAPLFNEKLNAKMIFLRGVSEERIELFEYL